MDERGGRQGKPGRLSPEGAMGPARRSSYTSGNRESRALRFPFRQSTSNVVASGFKEFGEKVYAEMLQLARRASMRLGAYGCERAP